MVATRATERDDASDRFQHALTTSEPVLGFTSQLLLGQMVDAGDVRLDQSTAVPAPRP